MHRVLFPRVGRDVEQISVVVGQDAGILLQATPCGHYACITQALGPATACTPKELQHSKVPRRRSSSGVPAAQPQAGSSRVWRVQPPQGSAP